MFKSKGADRSRSKAPSIFDGAPSPAVQRSSAPRPPGTSAGGGGPAGPGDDGSGVQLKPVAQRVAPLVSHWAAPGRSEDDRPRFVQRRAAAAPGGGGVHEAARAGTSGSSGPLPHLSAIQRSFGRHDVSQIKAHTGAAAAAGVRAMGAEAFATGDRVAFAGAPSLHTAAHEAAHVVQQRAGVQLKGGVGQAGDAYERHADAVADLVVQGKSAEGLLDQMAGRPASGPSSAAPSASGSAGVQRKITVGPAGGKSEREWETKGDCMSFYNDFADEFPELQEADWVKLNFYIERGAHNFDSVQQMIAGLRHKLGLGPAPQSGARARKAAARGGVAGLIEKHKERQESDRKVGTSAGAPVVESGREQEEGRQAALARHREQRAALRKIVELGAAYQPEQIVPKGQGRHGGAPGGAGMDADAQRRLANSCEWVKSGRTKLYAVTPTHDNSARLKHAGKNPGLDEAFFPVASGSGGRGHIFEDAVEYDSDNLADPNVDLVDRGKVAGGWNLPGVIAVTNARLDDKEKVWQTLRHEVQHDADQHFDKEDAFAQGSWQWNLEQYKTEYRAHNYERGSGRDWDETTHDQTVSALGYTWTQRQHAIFQHLFRGYWHTKEGWGADASQRPLAKGAHRPGPGDQPESEAAREQRRRFQEAVVAYANPDGEGFNKYNSVRVDSFYRALSAIPPGTTHVTPEVKELMETCFTRLRTKLQRIDAQYILHESPDFSAKLAQRLGGTARAIVRARLDAVR